MYGRINWNSKNSKILTSFSSGVNLSSSSATSFFPSFSSSFVSSLDFALQELIFSFKSSTASWNVSLSESSPETLSNNSSTTCAFAENLDLFFKCSSFLTSSIAHCSYFSLFPSNRSSTDFLPSSESSSTLDAILWATQSASCNQLERWHDVSKRQLHRRLIHIDLNVYLSCLLGGGVFILLHSSN